MEKYILDSLEESKTALMALIENKAVIRAIEKAGTQISTTFNNGGRVFSCGNGGSMCDAIHFAEELSGRYRKNRKGLAAIAISDPGHLSCVSNDFGYKYVFSRYLESHAVEGDCFLGISTSGTSENVILAAEVAKKRNVKVITLTGKENRPLQTHSDIDICTPGGQYADRVQELHIKVIHILIELVERKLFPENYL